MRIISIRRKPLPRSTRRSPLSCGSPVGQGRLSHESAAFSTLTPKSANSDSSRVAAFRAGQASRGRKRENHYNEYTHEPVASTGPDDSHETVTVTATQARDKVGNTASLSAGA